MTELNSPDACFVDGVNAQLEIPADRNGWEVSETSSTVDYPLLDCLLIVAKLQNRATSAMFYVWASPNRSSLVPGIVYTRGDRAGLSAKVVKRPLNAISDLVLPAVCC